MSILDPDLYTGTIRCICHSPGRECELIHKSNKIRLYLGYISCMFWSCLNHLDPFHVNLDPFYVYLDPFMFIHVAGDLWLN